MEIVVNNLHKIIQGDVAKKQYKSLHEPIFFCVTDINNYTLNVEGILVNEKTIAKRKIPNYHKASPKVYNSETVSGNISQNVTFCHHIQQNKNYPTQKTFAVTEHITKQIPFKEKWSLVQQTFCKAKTT